MAAEAGPNNALEPTPTASARASLRLLARLTASVRCQGNRGTPPKTTIQARPEGHVNTRHPPITTATRRIGYAHETHHGPVRSSRWRMAHARASARHQSQSGGTRQRGGSVQPRQSTRPVGSPVPAALPARCSVPSQVPGPSVPSLLVFPFCPRRGTLPRPTLHASQAVSQRGRTRAQRAARAKASRPSRVRRPP